MAKKPDFSSYSSKIKPLDETNERNKQDILSTTPGVKEMLKTASTKYAQDIPLSSLVTFNEHPFSVRDNTQMRILQTSLQMNGQMEPIIVRKLNDAQYEIIAGHRRCHALRNIGATNVSARILEGVNDTDAKLIMLATNLGSREMTPTEKGAAYYSYQQELKKRQETEEDINVKELLVEVSDDSLRSIYNYIKLTALTKEWQDEVDDEIIPIYAGVKLSDLSTEDQIDLYRLYVEADKKLNIPQAEAIKKACTESVSEFPTEKIRIILGLEKEIRPKKPITTITIKEKDIPAVYKSMRAGINVKKLILDDAEAWRRIMTIKKDKFADMDAQQIMDYVISKID